MSDDSGKTTYYKLPWGPAAAFWVSVLAFFVSQLALGILLGMFFGLAGWDEDRTAAWTSQPFNQFLVSLLDVFATLGVLGWFLHARRAGFKALGFARAPHWKDLGLTLLGFVVYFGLLIAVSLIASDMLGVDTQKEQDLGFETVKAGGQGLLWVFLSLVILPPIVEEILFRGFMLSGLRTKLPLVQAALITSLLFGALHLFGASEGLLWIAAIDTFIMSLVLCYLREKTGALWAPIGLHAIKNCLAFLVVFVV